MPRGAAVGTLDEIYDMPANRIVAGLFGSPPMNFLDAELTTREDQVSVTCGNMTLPLLPAVARDVRAEGRDREVILGVRPEAIHLAPHPKRGSVPASIYVTEPLGHNLIADVRFGDRIIRARADRNIDRLASLQPDDPVYIRFDAAQIHVFDRDGATIVKALSAAPRGAGQRYPLSRRDPWPRPPRWNARNA